MASLSFRPCYGKKVATPPPVANHNSPPKQEVEKVADQFFSVQKTQLDHDKILTSRILNVKKMGTKICFASYLRLLTPETRFNAYHWVTWFRELATNVKLQRLTQSEREELKEICDNFNVEKSNWDLAPGTSSFDSRPLSA